ncbi:hypothetical protein FNAPI_13289 [Fusarium napiforme]|uniref:Uncharacterized protein n=1 Tax=Fusarium napiforme TaxID=42672 RepID=A0A8H5I8A9_9HYPO|nr:hypothetical protein FNAPI_13289 [Fusarium napiforme]
MILFQFTLDTSMPNMQGVITRAYKLGKTPIQVPDTPDSTNDTDVSDLPPTTGPAADGPQTTKAQAPESDDIDAGPVEATSDLRYDSSSESARPHVETSTSQPVPGPTIDAEQPSTLR